MRFILNDMRTTYNHYLGNTSFKLLFRMTLNSFFGVVRMNTIFVICPWHQVPKQRLERNSYNFLKT